MIKLSFTVLFVLFFNCAGVHKFDTVIADDYKTITNWKKNGVKVISVDTIHTIIGDKYKVKIMDY